MTDWEEIIGRDGGPVWQTAYRILGNRADADECFQEAFLAAVEFSRRKQIRDWRALLKSLATARAVDRLRQRRRRAARHQVAEWDAVPDRSPAPSQVAEDAELSERLRMALGHLPSRQAEAFCLHCLEDWSYREVAEHLTVSVDSVGVLLHRARKRLRQLLGDSPTMPPPRKCDPATNVRPADFRKDLP